jgi:UDP-2-acetamido-3-amino-2,3-dideoxy-glucuronate N-acetyltransferase
MNYFKHPTAVIDENVTIGTGTKIWHHAHIRENVVIGKECVIGQNVYIDAGVVIGDYCRIQNNCSIYRIAKLGNFVFIGPGVVFTNDRTPRAFNRAGKPTTEKDWNAGTIIVADGASIGARSVILPDITIGEYALIGAGSVVTKNVEPFTLVYGNPAKIHGKVDKYGRRTP